MKTGVYLHNKEFELLIIVPWLGDLFMVSTKNRMSIGSFQKDGDNYLTKYFTYLGEF